MVSRRLVTLGVAPGAAPGSRGPPLNEQRVFFSTSAKNLTLIIKTPRAVLMGGVVVYEWGEAINFHESIDSLLPARNSGR